VTRRFARVHERARIIERAFYHLGYLITIIHFYENSALLSGIRSVSLYKCIAGYTIWETNYSEYNMRNSLRPARRIISRDVAIPIVRAMEYARAIQRKVFVFCISHFFCVSVRARARARTCMPRCPFPDISRLGSQRRANISRITRTAIKNAKRCTGGAVTAEGCLMEIRFLLWETVLLAAILLKKCLPREHETTARNATLLKKKKKKEKKKKEEEREKKERKRKRKKEKRSAIASEVAVRWELHVWWNARRITLIRH